MAQLQITCITLSPPNSTSVEHITHVGYGVPLVRITVEEVIKRLKAKTDMFYVKDASSGKTASVDYVEPSGKKPYIRTHADSTKKDNLLSLPQCK